jgi:hypothetical protein
MVYGMEVYNAAIRNGGLRNSLLVIPPGELAVLSVIVFLVQELAGGPLARKLATRLADPRSSSPVAASLAMSVSTVCFMCPMMSLVATLLFKGIDGELFSKWIQTIATNLPMAFCWQLLVAGPLVRLAFRKIFARQLA